MKLRTGAVAEALVVSLLAIPAWRDNIPPEFHTEMQIPHHAPELTRIVSTANASAHTVTYSTPGFAHRSGGNAGQLATEVFYSVDAAKNAPFPSGFTFARFEADGGVYVFHSAAFDWEFFKS
jgi:hypothetical protein